jgi:hypothetical protein
MIFKRSSILASFQECGLIPYNPAIILKKIKEFQAPSSLYQPMTPSIA